MGFTEKPLQMEGGGGGGVESEVKKWVIAGIPLRSPLKPIFTKAPHQKEIEEENSWSTPTSEESRIPSLLACPPPPRKKPKPPSCEYYMGNSSSSSSGGGGVIRDFFTPPHDFENLFTRRAVERAA